MLGLRKVSTIPEMLDDLKVDLQLDLERKMEALGKQIEERLSAHGSATDFSDKLEEAANNLNALATGLEAKITKVTDSTTQLANTATSYRDALLNKTPRTQTQAGAGSPDPALNAAASREARQVLVQLTETDVNALSQETILEKATEALKNIRDPPPLEGTMIMEVTKLKKGAVLLLFNSKKAVNWILHPDVEIEFTVGFIPGATLKPRQFALLVPRAPLTFDPDNDIHLREIEKANGLNGNAITKAKWIKPVNH